MEDKDNALHLTSSQAAMTQTFGPKTIGDLWCDGTMLSYFLSIRPTGDNITDLVIMLLIHLVKT